MWLCQCGVCGVNMPVWRVYAGVLYSCNTVRVCDPCRSVTLYGVVSSTFVSQWKYRYVYLEFPSPFFQLPSLTIPVAKIYNFRTLIFTCLFYTTTNLVCFFPFSSRCHVLCRRSSLRRAWKTTRHRQKSDSRYPRDMMQHVRTMRL